jgi:WD40 repeat protein/predicted Ser/Thr protein kinase
VKVGPYEVLGELGRGGAGVVYRARATSGDEVAVKLLVRPDPQTLARFERERRLLAELKEEDGFVPLLDAGSAPQGPYIVMPFLRGGTLRTKLARGRLGIDESLALARSLATALARAHESGIVHRDLKPENVLFGDGPRPLVADLGLAKHFEGGESTPLSKTNEYRGTIGYMAPEQAADAKSVGPPADVFSLGAILYECLTGTAPFDGATAIEVLTRTEDKRYERLRSRRPDAPAWLERAIDRALEPRPEDRFQDTRDFARALEPGAPASRRRAALVLAGVGAGAVALALVARDREPPRSVTVHSDTAVTSSTAPVGSLASLPPWTRVFVPGKTVRLARAFGWFDWRDMGALQGFLIEPDSRHVVVSGERGGARVFDLEGGASAGSLASGDQGARGLARTSDGVRLLGFDSQRTVRVWNAGTHELVSERPITTEAADLARPVFSPDGSRLAVFDEKGALLLHVTETGALSLRLGSGYEGRAFFTADGAGLVVANGKGEVELLDLAQGKTLRVRAGSRSRPLAVAPGGGSALVADASGLVSWDLASGAETSLVKGAHVTAAAFTLDGRLVAVAREDGLIEVRDAATGERLRELERRVPFAFSVAFSPDGARVVVAAAHDLHVFDAGTGAARGAWGSSDDMGLLAVSSDGRRLATADAGGTVVVWNAATGEPIAWLETGRVGRNLSSQAFAADGHLVTLCRGTGDGVPTKIMIWDPARPAEPELLVEDISYDCAVLTPDGLFAAAGMNVSFSVVKLWDLRRREIVWQDTSKWGAAQIGISPDARLIVESSYEGAISLHHLGGGRDVETAPLSGKAELPDVTARNAYALRRGEWLSVLDTISGAKVWTWSRKGVEVFAVSSDEKLYLVGTAANLELIDASSHRVLDEVSGGSLGFHSVRFAPGGRSAYVGTLSGVVLELELAGAR